MGIAEKGIEVSSKGKTSDFGSENRGSIPLTSTKSYKGRGMREWIALFTISVMCK